MRSSLTSKLSRGARRCPRPDSCRVCMVPPNPIRALSLSSEEALDRSMPVASCPTATPMCELGPKTREHSSSRPFERKGPDVASFGLGHSPRSRSLRLYPRQLASSQSRSRRLFPATMSHQLNRPTLTDRHRHGGLTTRRSFSTSPRSDHDTISPLTARPSMSQASPMTSAEESSPPTPTPTPAPTQHTEGITHAADVKTELNQLMTTLSAEPSVSEPKGDSSSSSSSAAEEKKGPPGRGGARKPREPAKLVTLASYAPSLLGEFHPTKNKISINDLIPENALVWWVCPHGLTFSQVLSQRLGRSKKNKQVNLGKFCELLSLLCMFMHAVNVSLTPSIKCYQNPCDPG